MFGVTTDNRIIRTRCSDAATLATSAVIAEPLDSPRMALDATGKLFVSNGRQDSTGKLYAFDPSLRTLTPPTRAPPSRVQRRAPRRE